MKIAGRILCFLGRHVWRRYGTKNKACLRCPRFERHSHIWWWETKR